ncbi:hypothetical protein N7540_005765 [Penicillium herquei]|nr:hypothetical protein N7540_005765 [Penicillium herquei]
MTGLAKFILSVQKIRAAIHHKGKSGARQTSGCDLYHHPAQGQQNAKYPSNSLRGLPAEIKIKIFACCKISDFSNLKLACRAFYDLIRLHEHEIARQYLYELRHGTLPSPIATERIYTGNPEDDVILLSDLFPPHKNTKDGYVYTFKYLSSLRRRQSLCLRLCHYLADRMMDRFIQTEPTLVRSLFPTKKNERGAYTSKGIYNIVFYLTPLMYYLLYFLESYKSARSEHRNMVYGEYEFGRLHSPIIQEVRQLMHHELQTQILQSPPFTNTPTLIATNHCMQLLVSHIRYTMSNEDVIDDSWISSLLTLSPFVRIIEFFSAEIGDGGSQWTQRKDFMNNFGRDIKEYERDKINSKIFARASDQQAHGPLDGVWFNATYAEMSARGAIPHNIEKIYVWDGIPLNFGCGECRHTRE